jgi:hypothetical protein
MSGRYSMRRFASSACRIGCARTMGRLLPRAEREGFRTIGQDDQGRGGAGAHHARQAAAERPTGATASYTNSRIG